MPAARCSSPVLCLLALASMALLLAGCGGGDGASAGGPRLLLADDKGIAVLSLDDLSRRRLLRLDDGSFALDPALSPDGRRIAFTRQPPAILGASGGVDFGADLYLMDSDGRNARAIVKHTQTAEFAGAPAWLDNDVLLFELRGRGPGGESDLRLEKFDLRAGARSRFLENALDPSVSPAGDRIVFVRSDPQTQAEELVLATPDLAEQRALVTPANRLALFSAMVFSPDGSSIAFAAVDLTMTQQPGSRRREDAGGPATRALGLHPFAQDIWLVNVDGSGLRRASDLADNMPSLAFPGTPDDLIVLGPTGLWRLGLADGAVRQLQPGFVGQIAWLPPDRP